MKRAGLGGIMSDEDLKVELERLRSENAALKKGATASSKYRNYLALMIRHQMPFLDPTLPWLRQRAVKSSGAEQHHSRQGLQTLRDLISYSDYTLSTWATRSSPISKRVRSSHASLSGRSSMF
jgi:hypothetical protein